MPRMFLTALLILCLSLPRAFGDEANPKSKEQLQLSTERLVLFKDGYGLVIKKGSATADAAGRVFTTDVPDGAVLGCFWAVADDKKILAMQGQWDESRQTRSRETACLTVGELIRANIGNTVTLELTDKTDKGMSLSEEGKLVELLDMPAEPLSASGHDIPAAPAAAAATPPTYTTWIHDETISYGSFAPESIAQVGGTLLRELTPRGGEFVVLDRQGGRMVLPISRIHSLSGANITTHLKRQEEVYTRSKRLSFDFGKESAGKPVSLRLYYFTPGLRWIPTYRITGDLKEQADIALQGEILNDVTDAKDAAIDLVVGVPNFRFKETPSPLTLERTLRIVLANADNNRIGGNSNFNNAVQTQMGNNDFRNGGQAGGGAGEGDIAIAPELAGTAGEQDLFVYSANAITLKKGGRATIPLWSQSAALRHLYTYDIKARRSRSGGGFVMENPAAAARSPLQIQMNQVWHQLELTNAGKIPWTTGAALMLRGNLPIGQDLLTYTPAGGKARVPVTIAVDLRGSFDETEVDRKPNALQFDGYQYALVRKKGVVTLANHRAVKSDMRVTLATGGKVTAVSDDGKIKLNDAHPEDWDERAALVDVNNHSDVTWELSVDAGQTKTVTYEVEFYLR